jgi:hypothetical protein
MSYCSFVNINLIVIATIVALIAEKVDFIVVILNEFQTERLIPTKWENIE